MPFSYSSCLELHLSFIKMATLGEFVVIQNVSHNGDQYNPVIRSQQSCTVRRLRLNKQPGQGGGMLVMGSLKFYSIVGLCFHLCVRVGLCVERM